jgi:polysaccharide biosynthesis transport protein
MTDIVKRSLTSPAPYIPGQLEPGNFHLDESLDVRRIVEKLLKRKFQILFVALIVLIPAAIATYLATPLYRSTVMIQVNVDGAQVLPYRDAADFVIGTSNYESVLRTQEQILRGPTLVARVSQRLNSEPKQSQSSIEVAPLEIKRIENSQLFQASYLAPSPELAAKVVNLFAEEYIKQQFENRQTAREKARQALERELAALEKRVQISEKELAGYARNNNIMSLDPGQGEPVQKKLAALDQQVTEVEAELATSKSRLQSLQNASIKDFPEKLATQVVQNLTSTVLQLEHELTTMRATFGENWPAVIQKRNEIALVREQLTRQKSAVLAQAREQAQLDLQAVETKHRIMSTSLAEQKGLVNHFHDASIQYNILRREVETNRKLYEGLLERLKQSGVMAGLEFGNIQVPEPGRPDYKIDSPKIWWNLGLASILGLSLGVCVAFLLDFWDSSISTLTEAEQLAVLPVLGSVPSVKCLKSNPRFLAGGTNKTNGALAKTTLLNLSSTPSAQSPSLPPEAVEAMRAICASILLSQSEQVPQVIVVTSATPDEGKTSVVGQLGLALAGSGLTTLLVEADLRKPALAKIFGVGNEGGLSLFLSGVSPLPQIHPTDTPNLSLVTAGPRPPNPVALFNSAKLNFFLHKMTLSFKFVILDSPPLLAVADSRVLGSKAHGVVLVVRAGRTAKSLVLRAHSLLQNSGANVLGMILNGADPGDKSAYYRYSEYYEATRNS